jgi:hypothetical protein
MRARDANPNDACAFSYLISYYQSREALFDCTNPNSALQSMSKSARLHASFALKE